MGINIIPPTVDGGPAIFAHLTSNIDQEPTVLTPVVITYEVQEEIQGLTHSTTVNPEEVTIDTAGVYYIMGQPQFGKDSGGTSQTFSMFLQIDRGSGFVDEPNSSIMMTVVSNTDSDVAVLGVTLSLNIGDKIRLLQVVTSTAVGLGLKFTASVVGPPTQPATPSIILSMFRVGE